MRVAVIHDWLYVVGGAELVLKEILACYPQADVFTLFDFLSPADRRKIGLGTTTTSFLQKLPFMKTHHRSFLPLMPIAIEQFDLSGYDLIISSSCAVACCQSAAWVIALTTAMLPTPVPSTAGARSRLMPPIATVG